MTRAITADSVTGTYICDIVGAPILYMPYMPVHVKNSTLVIAYHTYRFIIKTDTYANRCLL